MKLALPILLLGLSVLSGQAIILESSWSKDTVLIGEPVFLRIKAQVPDDAVPHFSGLNLTNPAVSLDSTHFEPLGVQYAFTFWEVGEMTLPGIPVQIERLDGSRITLSTDSLSVHVVSSLTGGEQDIREIKEMVPLSLVNARSIWLRIALLLLLAGVVILLWLRRQREARRAEVWQREHADQIAFEALAKLRDQVYQEYDAPERYEKLSLVLRGYLEARFLFKALEMTTSEIRGLLPDHVSDPAAAALIGQLLERADMAKFAKQRHEKNMWRNDLDLMERIIQKTRPVIDI